MICTKEVNGSRTDYRYHVNEEEHIDIVVGYDHVSISSNLQEDLPRDETMIAYNNAIDGIEAILLGLAETGFDMSSDQIVSAVEAALDAIGNIYGV